LKDKRFIRTSALIGESALEKLNNSSVIVFGVGGVGSYVIEALARAGIGKITIVDFDRIDISNINRQIIALSSTVGELKAEVAKRRVHDINPNCSVTAICKFVTSENIVEFDLQNYDAAADAVDNVTAKLSIAKKCYSTGTKLISSMGTGNKTDPTKFKICDIFETNVCPLAKIIRHEIKKNGIPSLKVVFSEEQPTIRSRPPASISFVPAAAGLLMASEIINNMILGK
jgi:tRNA A37 threonylcarbamoyladenosine dehydratase